MRVKIGLVICIVMFLGLSPHQGFATGEAYVGFSTGMIFPESLSIKDTSTANVDFEDIKLNKGIVTGLKAGWRPFENLAYEFEYDYLTNIDVTKTRIFSDPVLGSLYIEQGSNTINAWMFNVLLRSPGKTTPYIGAGVGIAKTRLEDVRLADDIFITPRMSDSDMAIAGQFLMGIESKLDNHLSGTLGYKFFYTNPDFPDFELDATYKLHMLTVGLNYTF